MRTLRARSRRRSLTRPGAWRHHLRALSLSPLESHSLLDVLLPFCSNLLLQGDASVQRRPLCLCSEYTTSLVETIDADFATSEEQRIVQCGSWRIASRAHRCVRMMDPHRIAAMQDSPGRLATGMFFQFTYAVLPWPAFLAVPGNLNITKSIPDRH